MTTTPPSQTLKVRVVAHKGKIVIVPRDPAEGIENRWWPTGGSRLGCVLGDTKSNLGVSQEALDLMRQVENGRDAIGDLDWWWCNDETYAFAWWGPIFRIVDPAASQGARNFKIHPEQCTIIPNEVPEKARQVIDANPEAAIWDEPRSIEPHR